MTRCFALAALLMTACGPTGGSGFDGGQGDLDAEGFPLHAPNCTEEQAQTFACEPDEIHQRFWATGASIDENETVAMTEDNATPPEIEGVWLAQEACTEGRGQAPREIRNYYPSGSLESYPAVFDGVAALVLCRDAGEWAYAVTMDVQRLYDINGEPSAETELCDVYSGAFGCSNRRPLN